MNLSSSKSALLAFVTANPGRTPRPEQIGADLPGYRAAKAALLAEGALVECYVRDVRAYSVVRAEDAGLSGLTRADLDAVAASRAFSAPAFKKVSYNSPSKSWRAELTALVAALPAEARLSVAAALPLLAVEWPAGCDKRHEVRCALKRAA